jgi:hypothetical protein
MQAYQTLPNFEYPHKDKLLDFIKYFFLETIVDANTLLMNYQAFRETVDPKRFVAPETSRNEEIIRGKKPSIDSQNSLTGSFEEHKKRLMGSGQKDDKYFEEEKMLDIAEQCFIRIADLLHQHRKTVKQVFLKYSQPEKFKDG